MPPRLSYRRRLRSRIFISFVVFALALVAAFASATVYLRARFEAQVIGNALQQNVNDYASSFYTDPNNTLAIFDKIAGWTISKARPDRLPHASWGTLKDGVYDLTEPDGKGGMQGYKLAVHSDPNYWFFLKYDTTQDQESQVLLEYALIGTLAVFVLLALLIGAWLSNRVIRPVTDLARRLRNFRENERVAPLAPDFANDEVGELASALDDYARRLTEMVERDREFNSDVSHELRTPLAVIATTTELLLGKPELEAKLRERLKRIERASRQSAELIEALLLLSRAERSGPMDGETSNVNQVAADVIASQISQLRNKPVKVRLIEDAKLAVDAPASVLSVALTNLVGNAIKYTNQGEINVRVGIDKVIVEDTGSGIGKEDAEHLFERGVRGAGVSGSGAGLGLAIVRRLCDLYGWTVSLQSRTDGVGTRATLDFRLGAWAVETFEA